MTPHVAGPGTQHRNDAIRDMMKPELNARVVRSLTLYFERRFGARALEEVFERTGLDPTVLSSEHNWVSMAYRDKLLEQMTEYAKDPRFAFYAGCYTTNREVIGIAYSILASFSSPRALYKKLLDLAPHYNRVGDFKIIDLTRSSLTCIYQPRSEEYIDDEYGADFRLGQLVAWPRLCGLPAARAEHKMIEMDGRPTFHYVFRWKTPRPAIEPLLGLLFGLILGVIGVLTDFPNLGELPLMPDATLKLSVTAVFGLLLGLQWRSVRHMADLRDTIASQQEGMSQVDNALLDKYRDLHEASEHINELNASLKEKIAVLERTNEELNDKNRTIEEFNFTLKRKVEEKTLELRKEKQALELLNTQLREMDQSKTRFFAKINHELRAPLHLLDSGIQSLLTDPDFAVPTPHRQLVVTMKQNARRVLRLINELLDLARVDAGKMRLRYEETDLYSYLSQIVQAVGNVVERNGLEFQTSLDPDLPHVWIDREKMESVVLNLIYNSLKFTPHGGTIRIATDQEGDALHIRVVDTGSGIEPELLPNIFDRFSEGTSPIERGHTGTGLGLSIVKEFVQLHNGQVTVDSKVGEGSEFTITLPIGEASIREDRKERRRKTVTVPWDRRRTEIGGTPLQNLIADAHEINLAEFERLNNDYLLEDPPKKEGKQTILVIDDEPGLLFLLFVQLRKKYNVMTASNRKEGLAKARTHMPDLIISDLAMWEYDAGNRLCAELKGDEKTSEIPVILMSARAEEGVIRDGFEVGADDYLTKPFNLQELHARTAHVIEKVRLLKEVKRANLKLHRQKTRIERMAITDALTELYNRHYLDRRGPELFSEAIESDTPLSCLMLDIDRFKQFNTDYTHAGGDAVLKGMGTLLTKRFQDIGLVARYGGEEFAILLPNHTLKEAVDVSEVFRLEVRKTLFELGKNLERNVTVSIGVASYPECQVDDYEALLREADEALFDAKVTRDAVVGAKQATDSSSLPGGQEAAGSQDQSSPP